MQCKFFVGQKVVCINDQPTPAYAVSGRSAMKQRIKLNEVYTISRIKPEPRATGGIAVCLVEEPIYSYHPDRFRPATDIQQFRDIVAEVFTKTPQLVDA